METAGKRFMKAPLEEDLLSAELKMGMGLGLLRKAADSRMYSFKDGTESLSRRLREKLEEEGRVTIRTDSPVQSLKSEGDQIKVRTGLQSHAFSHIISTIPLPHLFRVLPGPPQAMVSSFPPAVTVAVVNLYYPGGSIIMPIHGFGYLIPKTVEGNPENALGVIIVSDGIQGQDTGEYDSGVKLTVMLGGHYWRGRTSYPSDDELLAAAKSVVARDLGITAEPSVNLVTLQRECIPQYEVGYWERIQTLEGYLDATFGGERVKLVGSAVDGVGVNDCILSARRMSKRMEELAGIEDIMLE
jgi:oxygen-dependent protoporphyrinogen oxidase